MNKRNTDEVRIQEVVRSIHYVSQEVTLLEMTKNWSEADFLYAIERLDSDQPQERRDELRGLYHKLRRERQAEEARKASEAASASRHEEVCCRLEELKNPHWSTVPNFWMTLAILVLTAAVVYLTYLAIRR
jgi:hypothetical protein